MGNWRKRAARLGRIRVPQAVLGLGACLVLGLAGCGSGPMDISERSYLGASNGDSRVYYRVTITGQTRLGVSEFRQGWFPCYAVDALFGDVSAEAAKQQTVRDELRSQIDEAMLLASKNYLDQAVDPNATKGTLQKYLDAVRRVRLTARDSAEGLDGAVVMEYHPNKDLVVRHSDEKLVLVLSSNPDEIITQLAQLSESEKTEETINKFVQVLAFRERQSRKDETNARIAGSARLDVRASDSDGFDEVIASRLGELASAIDQGESNRAKLLGQVSGLIEVLKAVDESQGEQP